MNPLEEFLQLKKQAGFWSDLGKAFMGGVKYETLETGKEVAKHTAPQAIARVLGLGVAPSIAAGGMAGLARGASKGVDALIDRFTKARDYKAMLQAHPTLSEADAGTTQMYYNSLRKLSPSLAKDPLVAGSFVRSMLELQPEAGPHVPIATAKMLADAQKSVSGARDERPIAEAFMAGRPGLYEPNYTSSPSQLMGEQRFGPPPQGEAPYRPRDMPTEFPPGWGLTGESRKQYSDK
jgi:hypothetical protein